MTKVNKLLVVLVVILAAALLFVLFNDRDDSTEENEDVIITPPEEEVTEVDKPVGNYQFQDVESMPKAESLEDAFNQIFGEERYFTHGTIITEGVNYVDDYSISISIEFKPALDSRKEMIDFLHYLQHSELLTRDSVGNLRPDNLQDKYYFLTLNVYQTLKSGMNLQEPIQKWRISSSKVDEMDFSDKETMTGEVALYGSFEGVNPTSH